MSELSDQIAKLLTEVVPEQDKQGNERAYDVTVDLSQSPLMDLPGFDERDTYSIYQALRVTRRAVRHYSGKEWETPGQVMEEIRDFMLDRMVPVAISALSDGVLMGRKPSPVIKKHQVMDDIAHLFVNKTFRTESSVAAFDFVSDPDLMQGLRRYILTSVYAVGAASGFRNEGSLAPPYKVFDLWIIAMKSICIGLYVSGIKLGQKWDEQELLEGILSASIEEVPTNTEEKS